MWGVGWGGQHNNDDNSDSDANDSSAAAAAPPQDLCVSAPSSTGCVVERSAPLLLTVRMFVLFCLPPMFSLYITLDCRG